MLEEGKALKFTKDVIDGKVKPTEGNAKWCEDCMADKDFCPNCWVQPNGRPNLYKSPDIPDPREER